MSSHEGSSISGANSPEARSKRGSILLDIFPDPGINRLESSTKTSWQGFLRGLTETRLDLTDVLTEKKYSKKRELRRESAIAFPFSMDSTNATDTKCEPAENESNEPENEFSHRMVRDKNYKFQLALKSLDGLRYTVVSLAPRPSSMWPSCSARPSIS